MTFNDNIIKGVGYSHKTQKMQKCRQFAVLANNKSE